MSGHSKWANIKHRKGRMDAIRGKLTTKIGREITIAVQLGGADPTGNMRLKLALQKARANNIPKDNIQRAVQKGLGSTDGANYVDLTYEGYGPGGVAIMVEAMTDNRNRTAADVRHLFTKFGGSLGEAGCVAWMFKRKGLFVIPRSTIKDADELLLQLLDAGAEDVKEEEDALEVYTSVDDFAAVENVLEQAGLEPTEAKLSLVPDNTIAVDETDAEKLEKLLNALEEHDDVQEVHGNFTFPDGYGEEE